MSAIGGYWGFQQLPTRASSARLRGHGLDLSAWVSGLRRAEVGDGQLYAMRTQLTLGSLVFRGLFHNHPILNCFQELPL
jgi:hypothetical protein